SLQTHCTPCESSKQSAFLSQDASAQLCSVSGVSSPPIPPMPSVDSVPPVPCIEPPSSLISGLPDELQATEKNAKEKMAATPIKRAAEFVVFITDPQDKNR